MVGTPGLLNAILNKWSTKMIAIHTVTIKRSPQYDHPKPDVFVKYPAI